MQSLPDDVASSVETQVRTYLAEKDRIGAVGECILQLNCDHEAADAIVRLIENSPCSSQHIRDVMRKAATGQAIDVWSPTPSSAETNPASGSDAITSDPAHSKIAEAFRCYLEPDEQLRHWAYGTILLRGRAALIAIPSCLLGMVCGSVLAFLLFRAAPAGPVAFLAFTFLFSFLFAMPFLPSTSRVFVVGLTTKRLLVVRLKLPLSGLADPTARISLTEYSLDSLPRVAVLPIKGGEILTLTRGAEKISVAFVDAFDARLPGNSEHARRIVASLR